MTPLLSSTLLRGQTDERLVELAAAGHDRAFEAIVERYRRPLLRYLRRLLSDTLAEDVVQATFINAWSSLRTGTDGARAAAVAVPDRPQRGDQRPEEGRRGDGGGARVDRRVRHRARGRARAARRDAAGAHQHRRAAVPPAHRPARRRCRRPRALRSRKELGLTDGAVRQLVHRARTTLRGGITAVTPMPALHLLLASSGDSTVARVAEVAAGAGSAGAASVSLKAGAAAVLATGALVTGGPQLAQVVHPADKPAVAARASAPTTTASRSARASTIAQVTPAVAGARRGRANVDAGGHREILVLVDGGPQRPLAPAATARALRGQERIVLDERQARQRQQQREHARRERERIGLRDHPGLGRFRPRRRRRRRRAAGAAGAAAAKAAAGAATATRAPRPPGPALPAAPATTRRASPSRPRRGTPAARSGPAPRSTAAVAAATVAAAGAAWSPRRPRRPSPTTALTPTGPRHPRPRRARRSPRRRHPRRPPARPARSAPRRAATAADAAGQSPARSQPSMSRRAIASGGGMLTSPSPAAAAASSSRVNQRTSSSSPSPRRGSPPR